MRDFLIIFSCCLLAYLIFFGYDSPQQPVATIWKIPLATIDRQDWATVLFEHDAHFKSLRAPFENVKFHYHTGVDFHSGKIDQSGELVYAIATGKVIAIEDPPPQRRITIEHRLPNGKQVWSVYIHIIDEKVKVGDMVDSETVIARLMNTAELERYGKEYDHVHLEIMKKMPANFADFYQRETFTCYTDQQVDDYFYNPEEFLKNQFSK